MSDSSVKSSAQKSNSSGGNETNPAFADAVQRARQLAAKIQSSGSESNSIAGGTKRPLEDSINGVGDGTPEIKKMASNDAYSQIQGMPQRNGGGSDFIVEEYRVPDKMVGLIIGRGGEQILRLQTETGSKIQLASDSGGAPERPCTLTGSRESVQAVKAMIEQIINKANSPFPPDTNTHVPDGQYMAEMMIPGPKVGLLIGKGGENIRNLQEKGGVKMVLIQDGPQQTLHEKPLRISGDPQKVEFAKQMVIDLLAQKEMEVSDWNRGFSNGGPSSQEEIMVPRQAVGVVIGKGGDMIKRIQQDSGARVQFIQGKEDVPGDKLCQITGTIDQVQKASAMIRDLIQSVLMGGGGGGGMGMPGGGRGRGRGRGGMGGPGGMRPDFGPGGPRMGRPGGDGGMEVQFSVPANKCGLVIGKGGETVKGINQQSGAHVEIARGAPPNPHEKVFTIRGNPQQIEHAKQLIMERVGGMPPGQGGPPGGGQGGPPGGPQGQYPGPQYQQQYQQPGPGQPYAAPGWPSGAYQPWPNQPASAGVAVASNDPGTGQADYSAACVEYYRSLGMYREAELIEQQSRGGQAPVSEGMLKQLIDHWKSHRKKPTLLPEETDVHFEESSTVNPLFEDNEAAGTSEALGQLSAVIESIASGLEKDISTDSESNANLIDIDRDDSESAPKAGDLGVKQDSVTQHINNIVDKEEVSTNENNKKHEINANAETNYDANKVTNLELVPESNPKPSTSLQESNNKHLNIDKNGLSESPEFKNSNDQQENTKPKMILKIQEPPISPPQKPPPVVKSFLHSRVENENSDKLPAVSELIKKFQRPTEEQKISLVSNASSTEQKCSLVSSAFSKEHKENSVTSGTTHDKINENKSKDEIVRPEKESLSKIFSFPPPPPNGPLKTTSSESNTLSNKTNQSFLASVVNASKNLNSVKEVKTRSDSSLDRNKTVSSDTKLAEKVHTKALIKTIEKEEKLLNKLPIEDTVVKLKPTDVTSSTTTSTSFSSPKMAEVKLKKSDSTSKKFSDTKKIPDSKNSKELNSKVSTAIEVDKTKSGAISEVKQPVPKIFPSYRNESQSSPNPEPIREKELTETNSKKSFSKAKTAQETDKVAKSNSEDSGVTRGDQISSEATQDNQDNLESQPNIEKESFQTKSIRKSKRDRKISHHRHKSCKHCRRSHAKDTPLKRGKCDDYYDILTGAHQARVHKHLESWASDLSWEEKELIRRFRSRRESKRSDTPSMRSKHVRASYPDGEHFHRAQLSRRSLSDDSSFYGSSSLCSCDECWMFQVKDYAYGRASLRGVAPKQIRCTCRLYPEFLSKKVKFRSETIPEVSTTERSLTTPSIPEESDKKEDATSDASNDKKAGSHNGDVKKSKKDKEKSAIDSKSLKEKYRLMTPWEMEEWDLAMKKHLLIKRKKRARNMGLMALGMVIFIGLIVAVVVIYLRRKTL